MDLEKFKQPPSSYRAAPFWALNDRLEENTLREQIASFDRAGIGGFFMHSRPGLETPYLSEDWMEQIGACIDEAEKRNMLAWLYDEDSWPSGTAGGMLTRENPEYAAHHLTAFWRDEGLQEDPDTYKLVATFACSTDDDNTVYRRLAEGEAAREGERVLEFGCYSQKRLWYNGSPYLDMLNPEAVQAFIESTYEPYRTHFENTFGTVVPGIFTDEPNINPQGNPGKWSLPWGKGLAGLFQKRKGYDLIEELPALVLPVGDYRRIRYDYWEFLAKRFIEAFARPIYEWCADNGLIFTGHYWEHGFEVGMRSNHQGSYMAPLYWMQWPGIDLLGPLCYRGKMEGKNQHQVGQLQLVKCASSIAEQFGRERVLSETYGGAGWDLSFSEQREIADWQAVLGVGYVVNHLSLYSARTFRKRDFPGSFTAHQPWWEDYPLMGDYLGRLSYALSWGQLNADVLILHPVTGTWGAEPDQVDSIILAFDHLLKDLAALNYDFDLGDELIMEREAGLEEDLLTVGEKSYSLIIVPHTTDLMPSTVRLLLDYVEAGGALYFAPPVPKLAGGQKSDDLDRLIAHPEVGLLPGDPRKLKLLLEEELNRGVEVQAGTFEPSNSPAEECEVMVDGWYNPIYSAWRSEDGDHLVFLVNTSHLDFRRVKVNLPQSGVWEEADLLTGEVYTEAEGAELQAALSPGESRLLICRSHSKRTGNQGKTGRDTGHERKRRIGSTLRKAAGGAGRTLISLNERKWNFARKDPNIFVLDRCHYRVDNQSSCRLLHTGQAWREIMGLLGVEDIAARTGNRSIRPWARGRPRDAEKEVELVYPFTAETIPDEISLALEEAEKYSSVRINGTELEPQEGKWLDEAVTIYAVEGVIQSGENRVVLSRPLSEELEIENIYLLGDFGVYAPNCELVVPDDPEYGKKRVRISTGRENDFVLGAERGNLTAENIITQGYPFFSGRMIWSLNFELADLADGPSYFLRAGELNSVLVHIRVNGCAAPEPLLWPPLAVELTPYLQPGENELTLEVVNSLRNTLGPLHQQNEGGRLLAPGHFYPDQAETYWLVADGLPSDLEIVAIDS